MRQTNILGINITSEPLEYVLETIRTALRQERRDSRYVCATSVHGVIESQSDPALKNILNGAFICHPDGFPLAKVGRWMGARDMQQIRGPDLFPLVCKMTADMPVRHFFYGGAEGVAEALVRHVSKRFPGLQIAGTYCPPFRALTEGEKQLVPIVSQHFFPF